MLSCVKTVLHVIEFQFDRKPTLGERRLPPHFGTQKPARIQADIVFYGTSAGCFVNEGRFKIRRERGTACDGDIDTRRIVGLGWSSAMTFTEKIKSAHRDNKTIHLLFILSP